MTLRLHWTESQLAQYRNKQAKYPAKRQSKKPARVALKPLDRSDALVFIDIPWLTPLAGPWQRMHFRARRRVMDNIAMLAFTCMGRDRSVFPLQRAHVKITRYSAERPDSDGLNFVKPILDAMQVPSKRHPYGVGIIVDDSHEHLRYSSEWRKTSRGAGRVVVEVWSEPKE